MKPEPALPDSLRWLIRATVAIGTISVAWSAILIGQAPAALAVAGSVAAIALGGVPVVNVRHNGQSHSFTWSEAAVVAGLVLLPAWWLPGVGAATIAATYHFVYRRPAAKTAFNTFAFATAAFFATAVFETSKQWWGSDWVALPIAGATYWFVNFGSVSLAVARSREESALSALRSGSMLGVLFGVANTSVATLVAAAATTEPIVLLSAPPLLVQLAFVYRNTREVIDERDLWVRIQDISEQLQAASTTELPRIALRHARELATATTVELITSDEGRGRRYRLEGDQIDAAAGDPFLLAGDIWGRAAFDRVPFVVDRHSATARQRVRLERDEIDRALIVPLEWGGVLLGALCIGFDGKREVSDRARSALTTLGTQIASSLHAHRQTAVLRHQAEHDQLTGLPNRNRLVTDLDHRLDRARRLGDNVGVVFFDLDGFKLVNDSLGHHHGDELLVEAARRLRNALRPDDAIARFGGDEFIVVCSGLDHPDELVAVAGRLLDALSQPSPGSAHGPISASAGVSFTVGGRATPESMLRDADAAMYEAKRVGAGSACAFSPALRDHALERLNLTHELRAALDAGDIHVHFQPIVDAATGEVCELEALARWDHPERGAIPPSTFIAVAEESGDIRRLGEFVLQRSCEEMRRWLDLGIAGPNVRVSVNLSARQLDSTLPSVVGEAIARVGLPPRSLILEVTESKLVDDPNAAGSLQCLRDLGVRIALDDFGTGYSSLSALRLLPVDVVKIDRSFITGLSLNEQSVAMMRGIVDIAHALGMEVIAEGVEDQHQASLVADLGCDRAQGWFYGRPMSPALVDGALASTMTVLGAPDAALVWG